MRAKLGRTEFLKRYVAEGGTLYVSDMHYDVVRSLFTERLPSKSSESNQPRHPLEEAGREFVGAQQQMVARVTDPLLRAFLGSDTIPLKFDIPNWKAALFDRPHLSVHLRGDAVLPGTPGQNETAPLVEKTKGQIGFIVFSGVPAARHSVPLKPNCVYEFEVAGDAFSPRLRLLKKVGPKLADAKILVEAFPGKSQVTNLRFGTGAENAEAILIVTGNDNNAKETFSLQTRITPKAALAAGAPLKTIVRGDLMGPRFMQLDVPLLVRFPYEKGMVVFTSFHNSRQVTEIEAKLLEFLVFSSLTAKAESKFADVIDGAGFELQSRRAIQLSPRKETAVHTLEHQNGPLQLAVGFENVGARIALKLTAPSGETIEHEETKTFLIEIPDAPSGEWRFVLQSLEIPFANFPVVLGIAKGK